MSIRQETRTGGFDRLQVPACDNRGIAIVPMIILSLLIALTVLAVQRVPELQLDLTATPPPPPRPGDEGGVGEVCGSALGGSSHGSPGQALKVTLVDTDRVAYTVGDAMSFTVVLENTGDLPIVLGISRDPEIAPKTMRPCRVVPPGVHFRAALVAMTRQGIITIGHGFYGSLDAPGTTVMLPPGARARVHFPGLLQPMSSMYAVLTEAPQPVRVKAFVMIEQDTLLAEYSDNTLELTLTARRPLDTP